MGGNDGARRSRGPGGAARRKAHPDRRRRPAGPGTSAPGLIDTSLGRLATRLAPARAEVRIPAGRQGTAWEVARCALFLLGEDSSYVTGQTLVADGGLSVAVRS